MIRLIRHLATGNHERLARGYDRQYRHDRIGVRLMTLFGVCWCFLLPWPMSFVEFAAAPLYIYGAIRLTNTWHFGGVFLTRPLVLLVAAWCLWNFITLAWTPDPDNAWDDMYKLRFFIGCSMLWAVMDHRPWLVAALAAGFLFGNLVQFVTLAGAQLGIESLASWQAPDRFSGWWKPAVAGSLLVAALGLHLPCAFMGRGRVRLAAIAGTIVTLLGLLATGTRGGWLAGAGLLVVTAAVAATRAVLIRRAARADEGAQSHSDARPARGWLRIAVAAAAIAGTGLAAWQVVGPSVIRRIEFTQKEIWYATEKGNYSSFTGQRVLMARLALDAFAEHPLRGIGVGGFRAWTTERRAQERLPEYGPARQRPYEHAHNTLLHAAATTGLPGLVLTLLIMFTALWGALHPEQLGPGGLGTYAAGPGFAMIGLLLVSAFDSLQCNAATVALISMLFVMSLLPPPRTPEWVVQAPRPT